jgi:hypothetical protein
MMNAAQDRHDDPYLQFADGVALLTRGNFAEAYRCLCTAYDLFPARDRNPANADTAHVDLFRTAVMVAAGRLDQVSTASNLPAAQGMLKAWEGCKSSALGTELYHRHGGLVPEASARYQQAVSHFEAAIPLLEAGLGSNHPDLMLPLADYSGNLRAVGRDADAENVDRRAAALPPSALSPRMIGGGYPIIVLDPLGTNPLLPSQTT